MMRPELEPTGHDSTVNPNTSPEDKLAAAAIALPDHPPKPIGAFVNVRLHRELAYVSGQGQSNSTGRSNAGKWEMTSPPKSRASTRGWSV
ncbi:hypothetical protein QWZ10_24370 [Paracoccus cavernae]|uniref:Uncharacterized protein n=1 Tax=Paracoccus cavernae TaxID=1571207 RepID=A0ABT8DBH5_9RHOB|nr:hypothetical protein [Paracoccus cavernae]